MSEREVASDQSADMSVQTAYNVSAPTASTSGPLADANGRSAVVSQTSRTSPTPMAAYPTVPGKKPPALKPSQMTSAMAPAGAMNGARRRATPTRAGVSAGGAWAGRSMGAVATGVVTAHLSAGVGQEVIPRLCSGKQPRRWSQPHTVD